MRLFFLLFSVLAFLSPPTHAKKSDTRAAQEASQKDPYKGPQKYKFDTAHTDIVWFAKHFGFSSSIGKFVKSEGEIIIDKDAPQKSSVTAKIDTRSMTTGQPKFDDHLKNQDFLHVSKHPTATFKSTKVEVTGKKTAKVHGDFTLMGITKPIILGVTLNKLGTNPFNLKRTIGFTATTTFKRSDFGIKYALPGVSDDVKIHIDMEAIWIGAANATTKKAG